MDLNDIRHIMQQVPHRYPFLLVDRILETKPGESITVLKNVTINEPFFTGHFPDQPVMPGVLILEALAQAALLLGLASHEDPEKRMMYYFMGIDKARFKRPVVPGDQLKLHIDLLRSKKAVWKFAGRAEVDGNTVCSAELMAAPREINDDD